MADRYGTRCFGVLAAIIMSVALMLLSTQECLIELYMCHLIFGAMANAVCSRPPFPTLASGSSGIPILHWASLQQ